MVDTFDKTPLGRADEHHPEFGVLRYLMEASRSISRAIDSFRKKAALHSLRFATAYQLLSENLAFAQACEAAANTLRFVKSVKIVALPRGASPGTAMTGLTNPNNSDEFTRPYSRPSTSQSLLTTSAIAENSNTSFRPKVRYSGVRLRSKNMLPEAAEQQLTVESVRGETSSRLMMSPAGISRAGSRPLYTRSSSSSLHGSVSDLGRVIACWESIDDPKTPRTVYGKALEGMKLPPKPKEETSQTTDENGGHVTVQSWHDPKISFALGRTPETSCEDIGDDDLVDVLLPKWGEISMDSISRLFGISATRALRLYTAVKAQARPWLDYFGTLLDEPNAYNVERARSISMATFASCMRRWVKFEADDEALISSALELRKTISRGGTPSPPLIRTYGSRSFILGFVCERTVAAIDHYRPASSLSAQTTLQCDEVNENRIAQKSRTGGTRVRHSQTPTDVKHGLPRLESRSKSGISSTASSLGSTTVVDKRQTRAEIMRVYIVIEKERIGVTNGDTTFAGEICATLRDQVVLIQG